MGSWFRSNPVCNGIVRKQSNETKLPDPAPKITPDEVVAAWQALNVGQPGFARVLNVPTVTAVNLGKRSSQAIRELL